MIRYKYEPNRLAAAFQIVQELNAYRNDQAVRFEQGFWSVGSAASLRSVASRTIRDKKAFHTQSNFETSLRSYVTGRFRIKQQIQIQNTHKFIQARNALQEKGKVSNKFCVPNDSLMARK